MDSQIENSIVQYLKDFKQGCKNAEHDLVRRYWPRVVGAASKLFKNGQTPLADGDDIAISVFKVLCTENENGKFDSEDLKDHNELWSYLFKIMKSKVIDRARERDSLKRSDNKVARASESDSSEFNFDPAAISTTPLQKAIEIEREGQFWSALENEDIRKVVMLRLEGKKHREIAEELGIVERSVRRRIDVAKQIWKRLSEDDDLA